MLSRNCATFAMLLACATMVGCATSRSEIKLSGPAAAPASSVVASGRSAVIRSVIDERVFEQAPRDPSVPSLGFEGANQATAETKARAIGRKRNSYGRALGDVFLQSGQTVEGVVRENLAAALAQAGYHVTSEAEADASPLVIDVHIKQFWAWFKPGFWAITLNANIATDLDLSGAASPVTIRVNTLDKRQLATDGAWLEIIDKALVDYRAQVVSKAGAFSGRGENGGGDQ